MVYSLVAIDNRQKFKWIANGIGAILDEAFGAQAPSYAVTLK
jgi:hypothetical protein